MSRDGPARASARTWATPGRPSHQLEILAGLFPLSAASLASVGPEAQAPHGTVAASSRCRLELCWLPRRPRRPGPANFWTLIGRRPDSSLPGAQTREGRYRSREARRDASGTMAVSSSPQATSSAPSRPARYPRPRPIAPHPSLQFIFSELTLTTSLSSPLSRRALSTPTGDWSPSGSSARTLRVSAYRCCGPTPAAGTTPRCAR